ncbi:hypothetical protein sscle_10g080360 [Sclerotinia sclerotiorum 1980 UF-70]|uniref:Heterokaryon incompatibility domain-containing protein n=1 Tax=Sclerotinia sclerotiorum (strain ATCC 18683 / 1980 / Ss-1) TaxID=665079 RepID=A0A1D9QE89_SCLS1|nr:hypothetical protein sscle_10g080360 [Sclerotinia sclerotiorum 1980 UF-70]
MTQIYTPLNSDLFQIRRLTLQPAISLNDTLHGNLDVVSLESNPEYEALSYVWGATTPAKTINLDGLLISITPNLENALRNLRLTNLPRILWVDALCINQDDLDERASQVALMRRVYSEATTVLIWLGSESDGSDDAMRSIERFDKGYWKTYDFQTQFMEILFRPWFTRIWTVQEFVMGKHSVVDGRMKNPLFGCGGVWVEWLPFITAWAYFSDDTNIMEEKYKKAYHDAVAKTFEPEWIRLVHSKPVGTEPTSLEGVITGLRSAFGEDFLQNLPYSNVKDLDEEIQLNPVVWRARYTIMRYSQYGSVEAKAFWRRMELTKRVPITYHGFLMHSRGTIHIRKEPLTLETVLKGTMNLRSTDPRDKIYGILGLLSEEARAAIPIDYHKEPEWTFVPTMTYIIHHEPKGLALLGLLWRTRQFKTPLPSWVPDFTISADYNDEHNPVFLRGGCANYTWDWPQDTNATVSQDKIILSAHMINFGRVTHIISFIDGDRSYYISRFKEIECLLTIHAPLSEPLWRTLVGIRNTDHELTVSYPRTFEILMGRIPEQNGAAPKMFQDAILPIVRRRKFFITDTGFAGVATPMIRDGDMIANIVGMGRPAILRDTDSMQIGMERRIDTGRLYHRITGFAYVGCHDRDGFEGLVRENVGERGRHCCVDVELEECFII